MKFEEIPLLEQKFIVDTVFTELIDCVANGLVTFSGPLQAIIYKAIDQAYRDNMQWSRHEYVIEAAGDELMRRAQEIAEDSEYSETGELIKEKENDPDNFETK